MSEVKCYICGFKFFPQQISSDKGLDYCDTCAPEHRKRMQECHVPDCENKKIGQVKYCKEHWTITSELIKENGELEKEMKLLRVRLVKAECVFQNCTPDIQGDYCNECIVKKVGDE